MLGSVVLEVAAGLILVFLLVSMICTQIGNKVSEWLNWRARDLEAGIRNLLLNGDSNLLGEIYNTFYIQPLYVANSRITQWLLKSSWFSRSVFVRQFEGLVVDSPINIPAKVFAQAAIQAIIPDAYGETSLSQYALAVQRMPDSPVRNALFSLAQAPANKINDARRQLEELFNRAEEQMTAIYRQNMWMFALKIGIWVSIILNVDAVAIASRLWQDPTLRQTVNSAATQFELNKAPVQAQEELAKLNLPMGWQFSTQEWNTSWGFKVTLPRFTPNDWVNPPRQTSFLGWLRDAITKIFGWLITGAAAAQGAPFWFDILKKVTTKNTGSTA